MDEFLGRVAGLLIDNCLQYPISCSFLFSVGFYTFAPLFWDSAVTTGWRWVLSCLAGFVIVSLAMTGLIPSLKITTDRFIFRPTPSCSTFDNPARYICSILDENHQQIFYITTQRKCDRTDPQMKDASSYYILSSWIPSFDHYVTTRRIQFQPAAVPNENKPSYSLPENYCVRAAGPVNADPLSVAFYSLTGSRETLHDTGYINKTDLTEFHFGWYTVSNCRTELGRWLFSCEKGFVSSHYVTLPEYFRILFLEQRKPKE